VQDLEILYARVGLEVIHVLNLFMAFVVTLEQKMDKSFSWAFSLKFFHNYKLFFFAHVYLLHALIYGLKFILKQKKMKIVKKLYSL
jgi:hypothetical protein